MPCPGVCVYLKRFSREVPFADRYLADRTQRRTEAGAKFNPACRVSGLTTALHGSGQRFTASVFCRQDPLLGLLWSNGLLTSLGNDETRCRSGGQQERTREVMEMKLLLDGDGRL